MSAGPHTSPAYAGSEAADFLNTVFGGKEPTDHVLVWLIERKHSAWFSDLGQAAAYVDQNHEKDVYIGVALSPANHGRHLRLKVEGGERLPSALVGLWADIDFVDGVHKKANLPPNADAARSVMFPDLPPSVLIHSGGGLQAWWLFKEAERLQDEAAVRDAGDLAMRWNRALRGRAAAKGWDVDSVADLTRVLRIPGTANRKIPDRPRPVRLLEINEHRYNPGELAEYLDSIAPILVPARAIRPATASASLDYNPTVDPPFDGFIALCEAEPAFRRTYDHRRKDLSDQTASAYDMALANFAVQAGWTDQEIANLLIAHRRRYNEDLKLRDSYYAKTIAKARATFGTATENAIVEAPAEIQAAPAPRPETDEVVPIASSAKESRRKPVSDHLATISQAFKIPVVRVTKYGGQQDGTFELTVLDADQVERKIDLGKAIDVLNPRLTQGAIAGAMGAVIPNFKKTDAYLNVCRAIFAAAGTAPVEQAAEQQEMLSWIRRALLNTHTTRIDEADKEGITKLIRSSDLGWALWNQRNQLLIRLDGFMFAIDFMRIHANWKDVCLRLRKLQFLPGDLDGKDDGGEKKPRLNVWRSPRDFDDVLGVAVPDSPLIKTNISKKSIRTGDSGEAGNVSVN